MFNTCLAWLMSGTPLFGQSPIQESAEINQYIFALCNEIESCETQKDYRKDKLFNEITLFEQATQ